MLRGDGVSSGGVITMSGQLHNIVWHTGRYFGEDDAPGIDDVLDFGNDSYFLTNGIFANLTVAYGNDECFTVRGAYNVTIQDCIVGEPLLNSGSDPVTVPNTGNIAMLSDGYVAVLRNILHNAYARVPHSTRDGNDVRGNLIYNSGLALDAAHVTAYSYGTRYVNMIGNYIERGPASSNSWWGITGRYNTNMLYIYATSADDAGGYGKAFVTNNVLASLPSAVDAFTHMNVQGGGSFSRSVRAYNVEQPHKFSTPLTAEQARQYTIMRAGTMLPSRSTYEDKITNSVQTFDYPPATFYGWPRTVAEAGGYPTLATGTPYVDTDNDGMADEWELRFWPSITTSNGKSDTDSDGYTDLEEFLFDGWYCLWLDEDKDWGLDASDYISTNPTRWEDWRIDEQNGPTEGYGLPRSTVIPGLYTRTIIVGG